jgi:hypothetical protein
MALRCLRALRRRPRAAAATHVAGRVPLRGGGGRRQAFPALECRRAQTGRPAAVGDVANFGKKY